MRRSAVGTALAISLLTGFAQYASAAPTGHDNVNRVSVSSATTAVARPYAAIQYKPTRVVVDGHAYGVELYLDQFAGAADKPAIVAEARLTDLHYTKGDRALTAIVKLSGPGAHCTQPGQVSTHQTFVVDARCITESPTTAARPTYTASAAIWRATPGVKGQMALVGKAPARTLGPLKLTLPAAVTVPAVPQTATPRASHSFTALKIAGHAYSGQLSLTVGDAGDVEVFAALSDNRTGRAPIPFAEPGLYLRNLTLAHAGRSLSSAVGCQDAGWSTKEQALVGGDASVLCNGFVFPVDGDSDLAYTADVEVWRDGSSKPIETLGPVTLTLGPSTAPATTTATP
jgi:hypothetical protein